MTSNILDILGNVAYSLGDGHLTVKRNECAEWAVSFSGYDFGDPEYKPTLVDAILDAVARAAVTAEEIDFKQYEELEATKTKLQQAEDRLDGALRQLGVR
jgi:hypothetical protein